MRRLAALLAVPLLMAAGPAPDAPTDVRAAARAFDQAQISGDVATMERFLAKDFMIVRGSGRRDDRAGFIAGWTTPGMTFQPIEIKNPIHVPLGPDAAIIGGDVVLRGTEGGKPFVERFYFSDVFQWREGRWQVVFVQVTTLPAPKP